MLPLYLLRKEKRIAEKLYLLYLHVKQVTVRNYRRDDKSKILKQQPIRPKIRNVE